MSSAASLTRAGQQTKHPIVCLNGGGEGDPHVLIKYIEPGSIILFGVDDDIAALVCGNFMSEIYVGDGKGGVKTELRRTLLLYGCMDDPAGWGHGRLMTQTFDDKESVAVLLEPGMF